MQITSIIGDYTYSKPFSEVAENLKNRFKEKLVMVNHFCLRHQAFSKKQLAEMLGLAVQTLRNWRFEGRGPRYCKIGRAVRYQINDIKLFIKSSRVEIEAGTT